MKQTVDARGLSCPQPMMLTRQALQETGSGEVTVIVDSPAQVQSCSRTARELGWEVNCVEKADTYEMTMRK